MRTWMRSKVRLLFMTCAVLLAIPAVALASDVNVAVVDVTSPEGAVSLSPGGSGAITINMSVTGNQVGTGTFEITRDWTLSGGTFSPTSDTAAAGYLAPETFTVPARAGGDPATTFSTTGKVRVDSGQAAGGPFTLAIGAEDITNTNATGAKLAAGAKSNYKVTVLSDPCASVSAPAAPVISANPNTADGNSGWYKNVPTNVSAASATSGATIMYASEVNGGAKSAFSATAPTLGQGTTVVYAKATSATCNKVSESSRTFMVDSIAPDVNPNSVENTVWRNSSLSQAFTSSDNANGSGLADPTNDESFTLTASDESVDADTPTVDSREVFDVAGNSTTRSVSAKIDLTDPLLNITGAYTACGAAPTQPTFSPSDALSGLDGSEDDSWTAPTNGVGTYTYTAHAEDNAGNDISETRTYTRKYGSAYTGLQQPI